MSGLTAEERKALLVYLDQYDSDENVNEGELYGVVERIVADRERGRGGADAEGGRAGDLPVAPRRGRRRAAHWMGLWSQRGDQDGHRRSQANRGRAMKVCACGDEVKQIDLRVGPFGAKAPPFIVWVHVDRMRNLSHSAHDIADRIEGGDRT